ncbi:MAG: outer membrane lipoprotein carrier protein LolA [Bacteroidetes bacterium]|nr:MAG: outer membrane lipoprotein carrier protein LolA [Bacteroidota bacterium]
MHKRLILFIMVFSLSSICIAQPAGFQKLKDEAFFRKKFSETAAKLSTITADFTQVKNLQVLEEKITSNGKFWFKKPNMVKMEYKSPYKYLMIINQDKMTIRDETKTTTLSSRSNKLLEYVNKIIIDCVQGTAIDSKDFKVSVYESEKQYLLEMAPVKKEMKEFFSNIRLLIDKADYSVQRMEMIEPNGDNTLFTFLNKKFNESIADSFFTVQ